MWSSGHPDGFSFIENSYALENKNVYEIYHRNNSFNNLDGTYTVHAPMEGGGTDQQEDKRIGVIESFTEANGIKTFFSSEAIFIYHSEIDNEYEICICDISTVRRRANGRSLRSIPPNFVNSAPAPAGGNAEMNYYYADGSIVTTGTNDSGNQILRRYNYASNNVNDMTELVGMEDSLDFNTDGIRIAYTFHETMRRYCHPSCYAVFIGILAEVGYNDVQSTGMCFSDATCFPSYEHPNGDSIDTRYLRNDRWQYLADREETLAEAFRTWGFSEIGAGSSRQFNHLADNVHFRDASHNTHLHSGNLPINTCSVINS